MLDTQVMNKGGLDYYMWEVSHCFDSSKDMLIVIEKLPMVEIRESLKGLSGACKHEPGTPQSCWQQTNL